MVKLLFILALASGCCCGAGLNEARYQVRAGRFVDTVAGRPFVPRGFNYVRLYEGHGTFDPDTYDGRVAEALFEKLSGDGFNTVRVFVNGHANQRGALASSKESGLRRASLEKVADFLARAGRHGIGVVLSMDAYPRTPDFLPPCGPEAGERIHAANRPVLVRSELEAKARYLTAFIEGLRGVDAASLDAVLAYDLQNEWSYFIGPPFTGVTGTVTVASGTTYALPEARQRLADEAAVFCLDTLAAAVRGAHPKAPIWASIFTYEAVGKRGPGDFRVEPAGWKNRIPFRPQAILEARVDVLDLHFYSKDAESFASDLQSVGWSEVRRLAEAKGVVLVTGEFGAFKDKFATPAVAAEWLGGWLPRLAENGFQGWLYWTYDTHEQDGQLWHAGSGDGAIYRSLKTQAAR